jgi:hypothetical protein
MEIHEKGSNIVAMIDGDLCVEIQFHQGGDRPAAYS